MSPPFYAASVCYRPLKQLLRATRASQLVFSSQNVTNRSLICCRACSEEVNPYQTKETRHVLIHSDITRFIYIALTGTLRLQARPSKRPPRFYVPEKALQFSQPGATFQLGTEETHHALKYAQTAMLSKLDGRASDELMNCFFFFDFLRL